MKKIKILNQQIEAKQGIYKVKLLRKKTLKFILFYLLSFLSLGMFYIYCQYNQKFALKFFYEIDVDVQNATHLKITNFEKQSIIIEKQEYFDYNYFKYQLDSEKLTVQLFQYDIKIHKDMTFDQRKQLFKTCELEIKNQTYFQLIIETIKSPIVILQCLTIVIWYLRGYDYHAFSIFLISFFAQWFNLQIIYNNQQLIKNTFQYECEVQLVNNEEKQEFINSKNLLPGDKFIVKNQQNLPCDCQIISGEIMVNENAITGNNNLVKKNQNDNILYGGSFIVQCNTSKENCIVQVTQTGFNSFQGQQIRSIYLQQVRPIQLKQDAQKLFIILIIVCLGVSFYIYWQQKNNIQSDLMIQIFLNLFISCFRPELILSLNLALYLTTKRLNKKDIKCMNQEKLVQGGNVNAICFDKTGTLTYDYMDFKNYYSQKNDKMELAMAICHNLHEEGGVLKGNNIDLAMFKRTDAKIIDNKIKLSNNDIVERIKIFDDMTNKMSVLAQIQNNMYIFSKGSPEYIKDICQVDPDFDAKLQYYAKLGYRVLAVAYKQIKDQNEQPDQNLDYLGLLFFENKLRKESKPLIQDLHNAKMKTYIVTGDHMLTTIKSAQDLKIFKNDNIIMCDYIDGQVSLIPYEPNQPESDLTQYSSDKNLQCSYKSIECQIEGQIEAQIDDQQSFDSSVFYNAIQFSTLQFAVTGSFFEAIIKKVFKNDLYKKIKEQMIGRIIVYSRMNPHQKMQIVKMLQQNNQNVAFIGDGVNDCLALKQADLGISLGVSETTIAADVSIQNIDQVIRVLTQSKGCLEICINCFKFFIFCGLIQLLSIFLLVNSFQFFTKEQWIFQDLAIICPLIILISYQKPLKKLNINQKRKRILGIQSFLSIFGLCIIQAFFQVMLFQVVQSNNHYQYVDMGKKNLNEKKYHQIKNEMLFILSNYLLATGAIAQQIRNTSLVKYHKQPLFLSFVIIALFYNCLLTLFSQCAFFYESQIKDIPQTVILGFNNLLFLLIFIMIIFETIITTRVITKFI